MSGKPQGNSWEALVAQQRDNVFTAPDPILAGHAAAELLTHELMRGLRDQLKDYSGDFFDRLTGEITDIANVALFGAAVVKPEHQAAYFERITDGESN